MKTRVLFIETEADLDQLASILGPLLLEPHRAIARERGGFLTPAEAVTALNDSGVRPLKVLARKKRSDAGQRRSNGAAPKDDDLEDEGGKPLSFGDRILEALVKKPMTSMELAAYLQVEPKQVYGPCSVLKLKQAVVSIRDETDGQTRWKLAK
jgi:hypothetical protein